MLYDYNYHCTHCNQRLNEGRDVYFLVGYNDDDKFRIKLSKVPGVFGHIAEHTNAIKEGDIVNFYCSKCERDLRSQERPDLVQITLRVNDSIDYPLFISPVCGERLSYLLLNDELVSYSRHFFSILNNPIKGKAC